MIKRFANDTDDPTVDPRLGKVGKQKIEDTGALTKKRMETIDDETRPPPSISSSGRRKAGQAVLLLVQLDPHARLHARAAVDAGPERQPGNEYVDGMIEHDGDVGKLLKAIDDLGIANNTIVIYTTDNGPHMNSWPDGAMTPFRNEKNTNWEGAFRVPAMSAGRGTSSRVGLQRDRLAGSTGSRRCSPRRAIPASRKGCCTVGSAARGRPTRSTSTVTTSFPT